MKYKDYQIVPAPLSPNLYTIIFDGTGKVAEILKGLYTSKGVAMTRIDAYLEGNLSKRSKNAQTVTESGV